MVVVIMGVSGSGKSTIGRALARAVDGRFHDADDFHPAKNVRKMKSGQPLTEADREPWLEALRVAVESWLVQPGVDVLACSALKDSHRRQLGVDGVRVRLVYLHGSAGLIRARMEAREDGLLSPDMLDSQLAELEPPEDALTLDIEEPVETLVQQIRSAFNL
ncbi:MAG TPA: gluconokinase [Woeseiaceae bacterium]|nr:gluconokinase [Woeseiaceae bacterium]